MLEVNHLCKRYRGIPSIEDINFRVQPGEIVGYLGPNGSGKSTTVKIITGLLQPNEGSVLFEGQDIRKDMVGFRSTLGYVPEEAHVYTYLSGLEYLQLVGRLRGLKRHVLEPRMDAMFRLFSLWEDRHTPLASKIWLQRE